MLSHEALMYLATALPLSLGAVVLIVYILIVY
jgi:hypothetical protein